MPALLSLNSYHYRRGGSDVVYFEHEEMYRRQGWKTAHMAMHHPRNEASPWSEYFVDEIEFGHQYSGSQKLRMATKVIYSLEARRKLTKLLDRFRPSVAHAHCIYHHLSPSVLPLLRERGIPVVLTAHDLKVACPAYKMLNRGGICERCKGGNLTHTILNRCVRDSAVVSTLVAVESYVSRALGLYRNNVNRIVVPSQFYLTKLQEWGWPSDRLVYIPNYVDATVLEPDYCAGNYFTYFGRLAPEKGIETLVRAAIASGVELKIAGTGPLEAQLRRMAQQSNIEFLGYCKGEQLWELVRRSRAVVLPSEWYENAPMSVLESFALGKPVIGSEVGGIPELVSADTGSLFPMGNISALAETLSRFSKMSNDKISEMGRAGRENVVRNHNASGYLRRMNAVYLEEIERNGA